MEDGSAVKSVKHLQHVWTNLDCCTTLARFVTFATNKWPSGQAAGRKGSRYVFPKADKSLLRDCSEGRLFAVAATNLASVETELRFCPIRCYEYFD